MRDAIDGHRAHAADAFTAVMVKVNGLFVILDESFVDDVDHFEEGRGGGDLFCFVFFDTAGVRRVVLAPDFEG